MSSFPFWILIHQIIKQLEIHHYEKRYLLQMLLFIKTNWMFLMKVKSFRLKKEGSAYLSGKNPLVSTVCWQPRKRVRRSDENRVKIRSVAIRSYPLPTLCTIAREKCLTVTKPNLNIYRMYDRPTLKPVGKENIQFWRWSFLTSRLRLVMTLTLISCFVW